MFKLLHNLWCAYMHRRFYKIVRAEGDIVVVECRKCKEYWYEPRHHKHRKRKPCKPLPDDEPYA
jgi:formylmethanofuran dehydrogenase subunit E